MSSDDGCRLPQDNFDDTERSFASELSSSGGTMSTVVHRDGAELLGRPTTPIVTQLENSSPSWPLLPKSCTLHVFSGLSKSLSRSSLVSSRCADTASSSTSSLCGATVNITSFPLMSPSSSSHISSHIPVVHTSVGRWSLGPITKTEQQHQQQHHRHPLRDPCIIYDAQPSGYWTGRFVALRDKFRSEESLSPKISQPVFHAHTAERASTALSQQLQRERCRTQDKNNNTTTTNNNNTSHRYRFNTRLSPSATSAAILQQTTKARGLVDPAGAGTAQLLLRDNDDDDDDKRCQRVFVHMEAFCATDEARKSLYVWQRDYARKTGRKKLLPDGSSMMMDDERGSDRGSYFTRIIGGRRMSKRASVM